MASPALSSLEIFRFRLGPAFIDRTIPAYRTLRLVDRHPSIAYSEYRAGQTLLLFLPERDASLHLATASDFPAPIADRQEGSQPSLLDRPALGLAGRPVPGSGDRKTGMKRISANWAGNGPTASASGRANSGHSAHQSCDLGLAVSKPTDVASKDYVVGCGMTRCHTSKFDLDRRSIFVMDR